MTRKAPFVFALFCLIVTVPSLAQTEYAFHHQGILMIGDVVADGTYDLGFELYSNPALGPNNECGTDTHQLVTVEDGLYSVLLDFGDVFTDDLCRWLRTSVRESASPDPAVYLTPVTYLSTIPFASYAIRAATSDQGLSCNYTVDSALDTGIAFCPTGYLVTGGSCQTDPPAITQSYPILEGGNGWLCAAEGTGITVTANAICCKIN